MVSRGKQTAVLLLFSLKIAHSNSAYPNGAHPNGAHPNGAHPNGGHPNGAHPNSAHPNGAPCSTKCPFKSLRALLLNLCTFIYIWGLIASRNVRQCPGWNHETAGGDGGLKL